MSNHTICTILSLSSHILSDDVKKSEKSSIGRFFLILSFHRSFQNSERKFDVRGHVISLMQAQYLY